ncbi:SSI family serine proteinase inhibitor [Streptomyces sp. NPDC092369]|uniref:SSI family serine proteinase inhibitor n=1 Tax=Streptomyces sp. NPDC092369 TaxID=3366015 RepID=UPI0038279AD8
MFQVSHRSQVRRVSPVSPVSHVSPAPHPPQAPRRTRRLATLFLAVAASASLAPTLTAPAAQAADAGPLALAPPPVRDEDRAGDHLTVTVRDAGGGKDGTYDLYCHPGGGTHPDAAGACGALDREARWGRDTFAPVPDGSVCTMQYGGPATAHVTGVWAGRPVDASYDRRNGCEIGRWDRMVPLLPDLRARGQA